MVTATLLFFLITILVAFAVAQNSPLQDSTLQDPDEHTYLLVIQSCKGSHEKTLHGLWPQPKDFINCTEEQFDIDNILPIVNEMTVKWVCSYFLYFLFEYYHLLVKARSYQLLNKLTLLCCFVFFPLFFSPL
jgi:hypothetical protein